MDETPQPGVAKVEAINDTKLEVTFAKAVDEDLATEIEKSGERFVVFHGGQTANSADVIKSSTISFNADRTKADVILAETYDKEPTTRQLEADVSYTVALMDGDDNTVSSIVQKFGPQVLKKGAEAPDFSVNADQDKIVLDFKTKMADSAQTVGNYTVYENDKEIGALSEFVEAGNGKWVDATEKKSVEFKLAKDKGLLAGKTYKIKVAEAVETDAGKTLSDSQRTITVKTPSITAAQPVAKVARVVDNTIVVTFDKDLAADNHFNAKQITVKKPSGQTVEVTGVAAGTNAKEIVLSFADNALDTDLTYTIDLPANGVENAYFANASNKEVTGLKAQAQKDIEVTSVSAKLQQQVDNKAQADLLLTFNQRVDVEKLNEATGDQIVIKDGGDTYAITGALEAEIYPGDTSGKTVIIKDVKSKFAITGGDAFTPEDGATYTVELAAGVVKTDAGANAKTNQEKLKATVGGVSISAPEFDKIRMNSADEIVVEFKEDINASNLRASDIKVKGFELYDNGNFATNATLQGDSQVKFSVSGNKLTLKPASSKVKFATGAVDDLVTIAADSIKGKVSNVENTELLSTSLEDKDIIDRANPVIIGAQKAAADGLNVTFSEAVVFKGDDAVKQAAQFTVANASKAAYGKSVSGAGTEVIEVTFNEADTFKTDLDLSKVKVNYTKNTNVLVQDDKGNEAVTQTITGVKKAE